MRVVEIPIEAIGAPTWNPNQADEDTRCRLRHSIERFGLVVPLVVRAVSENRFETVGGAQRLAVLRELAVPSAACVVVEADEARAMLLAQVLNHIHGEDDLGLRAELLRKMLESLQQGEILAMLPQTAGSLQALAALGQQDLAEHLRAWQQAQAARLRHFQVQLTEAQLSVVQEAVARVMPQAKAADTGNPNLRGRAIYLVCKRFLEREGALP